MRYGGNESESLAAPGDQFQWFIQWCTGCHKRAMIYSGRFAEAYKTTCCIVCQKRRRGQPRPPWWVSTAEDLPKEGEPLADWEARKRANPGVFT